LTQRPDPELLPPGHFHYPEMLALQVSLVQQAQPEQQAQPARQGQLEHKESQV
jgi:hypothetical protein